MTIVRFLSLMLLFTLSSVAGHSMSMRFYRGPIGSPPEKHLVGSGSDAGRIAGRFESIVSFCSFRLRLGGRL